MKKVRLLLASAVIASASLCAAAPAEARTSFIILRNYTGYTIQNVYFKYPGGRSWGNDFLPGTIPNGYQKRVYVDTSYSCILDVNAVEPDGTQHVKYNLDVCRETYLDVVPTDDE